MNNYMVFNNSRKVPLLSRNSVWEFQFNGQNWQMDRAIEQLMAYHIFSSHNMISVAELLRANYKRIDPLTIDSLISYFRKTHPIEKIQKYSFKDIPVYAEEGLPLYIANPFSYDVPITPADEKELLEIIKHSIDPYTDMLGWFYIYVDKYALSPRYKRDIDIQYEELTNTFCNQHGIDVDMFFSSDFIKYQSEPDKSGQRRRWWWNNNRRGLGVVAQIAGGLLLAVLSMELPDFSVWQGIMLCVGLIMFAEPFHRIKND